MIWRYLKFSIIVKYHPSFPFICYMSINNFKFFQDFLKLALFPFLTCLSSIYFIYFISSLLKIFLKFIFNQKEKHSFIWAKSFNFLFQKNWVFYLDEKMCPLKIAVPEFSIYLKSTYLLLAIFLNFLFNQKEKRGFI